MQKSSYITLSLMLLSSLMIGCGDNNNNNNKNKNTTRFVALSTNNNPSLKDTTAKLEWTNGEAGCKPISGIKDERLVRYVAINFCDSLNYASHTNWRVASSLEMKTYIQEMKDANLTPFYTKPACPLVLALENAESMNLQIVNTHNTAPIAAISKWSGQTAGIRCVRGY